MAKKVKEAKMTTQGETLYKQYVTCSNDHTHRYTCGAIVDPLPTICPKEGCGAPIIDAGKDMCGQG